MKGWRATLLLTVLVGLAAPDPGAAQSRTVDRILERVGQAVERATEAVGEAFADAGDPLDWEVAWSQEADDFRWTGRLDRGDLLEIKGINGPIEVEPASGDEIEVRAQARARRSDPGDVRIEMVEHEGGLTFCAVYPTPRGKRENFCAPGSEGRMSTRDNDVQVRFLVRLPEGVAFHGKTVNGDVRARNLASDVDAETVNGDVEVVTTGFARANTVNGSIEATLGRADVAGGLEFTTVNGSISLDLPDDIDADVRARWVNGGLESDLPLTLTGRMSRRSARGTLGDGGPLLELSTVNGSIRVR